MDDASVAPKLLPFHLLEDITNGFSKDRKLGAGSYGEVYMGEYEDGETIAVKLLHYTPGLDDDQFEKEYHNLASLQHNNIVRLVGYAHETQRECLPYNGKMVFAEMTKRALCFEYMPNGSLDKFLSDESSGLDWCTRYAIIKGICEGIQYLHEELDSPMYHLDLKPANVLLDENLIPKIADFGLSRLLGGKQTQMTKSAIGTLGYQPPEYIDAAVISIKFDIFSLGVVIIKIMTGPTGYFRSAEMSPEQFIELVHENWKNRLSTTSLYESYSEQAKRCIEIALLCVDADRHKRPVIGVIIDMLNETETVIQLLEASTNDTGSYEICPCISTEFELMDIPLSKFVSYPLHVTNDIGVMHEVTVTTACDPASETATFEPIRPRIKMISCLLGLGPMWAMDVHPTKPWILLGHSHGMVSLWNHQTQENMMKWDTNEDTYAEQERNKAITAVKFIARRNWFVIGNANGVILVYSCNNKALNQLTAGGNFDVKSLEVHPSQPLMLSACDRLIKLWNWKTGWECIRKFEAHSDDVRQAKFNPHGAGDTFASASWDGTVKIWSIYSDTAITTLDCAPNLLICTVDYFIAHGDRQYIVVGSDTGTAQIWDLQSHTCIGQIKGLREGYTSIAVAVVGCPRGHQILVTISEDEFVSFCDSTTHRYENMVHIARVFIKKLGYIMSTKSLVIGYRDGFAIMETTMK